MLLLLLVHFFLVRAAPVSTTADESGSSSCLDINDCRTRWDIIWSCLATTLLCTWASLHPNIPEPVDRRGMSQWEALWSKCRCFIKEKALLFIFALLVPEYMLAWAIRQRRVASRLARENDALGLTKTHGFFIVMGGFHAFKEKEEKESQYASQEGEGSQDNRNEEKGIQNKREKFWESLYPLRSREVLELLEKDKIRMPLEGELQDRSKSSWLANTVVVFQTMWFVVQCIARGVQGLEITQLELITLAYALVNFGIYVAWWDKPRDVARPIAVFQSSSSRTTRTHKKRDLFGYLGRFIALVAGSQDDNVDLHERNKVPSFYSGETSRRDLAIAAFLTLVVGVIVGGLHCAAWMFEFQSSTQSTLWRISSVIIAATPLLLLLTVPIAVYMMQTEESDELTFLGMLFVLSLYLLMIMGGPAYVFARVTTVVLAFINLASLPSGAYKAVEWLNYVPHI